MQAAIYVSKEIVFTDAIRIGYGMGGVCNKKTIYDVLLDRYCIVIDLLCKMCHLCHHRFCVQVTARSNPFLYILIYHESKLYMLSTVL